MKTTKLSACIAAYSVALAVFAADMASQPWVKMKLNELHTNILDEVQAIAPTGGVSKAYVDGKDADTLQTAKSYADENDAATLSTAKSYTDANKGVSASYVSTAISDSVSPNPIITNGVRIATVGGKVIYAPEGGSSPTGGVSKLYVDTKVSDAVVEANGYADVRLLELEEQMRREMQSAIEILGNTNDEHSIEKSMTAQSAASMLLTEYIMSRCGSF